MLDSGAFSDVVKQRLTPEQALIRQLDWEISASKKLGVTWICQVIASYDFLITQRFTLNNWQLTADTNLAVNLTVEAAKYLASQRQYLAPRQLVLACQGINAEQYYQCVSQVIEYADNKD